MLFTSRRFPLKMHWEATQPLRSERSSAKFRDCFLFLLVLLLLFNLYIVIHGCWLRLFHIFLIFSSCKDVGAKEGPLKRVAIGKSVIWSITAGTNDKWPAVMAGGLKMACDSPSLRDHRHRPTLYSVCICQGGNSQQCCGGTWNMQRSRPPCVQRTRYKNNFLRLQFWKRLVAQGVHQVLLSGQGSLIL